MFQAVRGLYPFPTGCIFNLTFSVRFAFPEIASMSLVRVPGESTSATPLNTWF